jgi:hypothetical protein
MANKEQPIAAAELVERFARAEELRSFSERKEKMMESNPKPLRNDTGIVFCVLGC